MIQASPLTPFIILEGRKGGWRLASAAVAPSRVCFVAEGVCGGSRILQATCFCKQVVATQDVSTNTSWPRDVASGTPGKS